MDQLYHAVAYWTGLIVVAAVGTIVLVVACTKVTDSILGRTTANIWGGPAVTAFLVVLTALNVYAFGGNRGWW